MPEGGHKSGNTALQCVGGQERGKGKHGGIQNPAGIHDLGNAFFVTGGSAFVNLRQEPA